MTVDALARHRLLQMAGVPLPALRVPPRAEWRDEEWDETDEAEPVDTTPEDADWDDEDPEDDDLDESDEDQADEEEVDEPPVSDAAAARHRLLELLGVELRAGRARSNPAPGRQVLTHEGSEKYGLPIGATIVPGVRALTAAQKAQFASLDSNERPAYFRLRQEGATHAHAFKTVTAHRAPTKKTAPAKVAATRHPDVRADGSANPAAVRRKLLAIETPEGRREYLAGLGLNKAKTNALAKDLGAQQSEDPDRALDNIIRFFADLGPTKATPAKKAPAKKAAPRIAAINDPPTDLDKRIRRRYEAGESLTDIGKAEGISATLAHTSLTRQGVQLRPRGAAKKAPAKKAQSLPALGPRERALLGFLGEDHLTAGIGDAVLPTEIANVLTNEDPRLIVPKGGIGSGGSDRVLTNAGRVRLSAILATMPAPGGAAEREHHREVTAAVADWRDKFGLGRLAQAVEVAETRNERIAALGAVLGALSRHPRSDRADVDLAATLWAREKAWRQIEADGPPAAKKATPTSPHAKAAPPKPAWQLLPGVQPQDFGALSRDEKLRVLRRVAESAGDGPTALVGPRSWARSVLGDMSAEDLRDLVDQLADISNWHTSERKDRGLLAQVVINLTGLNPDGKVDTANGRVSFNDLRTKPTPTSPHAKAPSPAAFDAQETARRLGDAQTRDEAREILQGLSKPQLLEVSKATGTDWQPSARDTKNDIIERLASLHVGGRENFAAQKADAAGTRSPRAMALAAGLTEDEANAYAAWVQDNPGKSVAAWQAMRRKADEPASDAGRRIVGAERKTLARDVVKRYTSGASIQELADSLGRSYAFVHRILVESGVQLRPRGGAPRRRRL